MEGICSRSLCWLVVVGMAALTRADVFTNLHPVADTALFETSPDNNLGGWTNFPAGKTSGQPPLSPPKRCRGLIRFDLTLIPTNATVTSATLTVQVVKEPFAGVGSNFGLNRMLRA